MSTVDKQIAAFRHNTIDFVSDEDLARKLAAGRPLRIKFGCDPSAPNLHLGHAVGFEKLRQLQEFGHTIVFLVGDFTASIGDPSGRSKTRPALTADEVRTNAATYVDQVAAILDTSKIEIRFNSEWFDAMTPADMIRLASHYTVARMLERDDFHKRHQGGIPIAVHEFLYPLVQAYDSVALEADVEVGGTDQLFNLLLGREIQRDYGQEPQIVLTWPLMPGTDGVEKMSKSLGNDVGILEPPEEVYGKIMSIQDDQLPDWIRLLSQGEPELEEARAGLAKGENPRDAKAALARAVLTRYQSAEAAAAGEEHFDRVFRRKQAPEEIPEVEITGVSEGGIELVEVLVRGGFAGSKSAARRLVAQGGVQLDDERVADIGSRVSPGTYQLQVGKRRFARLCLRG